jgi:hypothetical protein
MRDCQSETPNGSCIACGRPLPHGLRRNCLPRHGNTQPSNRAQTQHSRLRPQPGNVLQWVIFHATAGQVTHGVGCETFRLWLNSIGWRRCLATPNRQAIIARLRDQAAAEGYAFTRRAICGYLVKAATHWLKSRIATPPRRPLLQTRSPNPDPQDRKVNS